MGFKDKTSHLKGVSAFFDKAFKEIAGCNRNATILDFGCGKGELVDELRSSGYNAFGSDPWLTYQEIPNKPYLKKTELSPYKIPFEDNSIDVVISTAVLEHAQNTEECFNEIHRVLKKGGYAMHTYPPKWYIPAEPHIHVPLVNWYWPKNPKFWLKLWAMIGVRNSHQTKQTWRETSQQNHSFCKDGICYRSNKYYHSICLKIFGNCSWPMNFFIMNSEGGFCKLARKLPFKWLSGLIFREFRSSFLVVKKV